MPPLGRGPRAFRSTLLERFSRSEGPLEYRGCAKGRLASVSLDQAQFADHPAQLVYMSCRQTSTSSGDPNRIVRPLSPWGASSQTMFAARLRRFRPVTRLLGSTSYGNRPVRRANSLISLASLSPGLSLVQAAARHSARGEHGRVQPEEPHSRYSPPGERARGAIDHGVPAS